MQCNAMPAWDPASLSTGAQVVKLAVQPEGLRFEREAILLSPLRSQSSGL